MKHSYLISVLERVLSAAALDALSLVKVVDETFHIPFYALAVLGLGHQGTGCCRSRDSLFKH